MPNNKLVNMNNGVNYVNNKIFTYIKQFIYFVVLFNNYIFKKLNQLLLVENFKRTI